MMYMYRLDTHVHTSQVSPCGKHSGSRMVQKYKTAGFDGIIITDHYKEDIFASFGDIPFEKKIDCFLAGYRDAAEEGAQLGLDVFLGMELSLVSTVPNEYLLYGFDCDFLINNPELYNLTPDELVQLARENNLALFQAHPFRPGMIPLPQIGGAEVFNGHFNHNSQNDVALKFAEENGLLKIAGSDCHDPQDVANSGILLKSRPKNLVETLLSQDFEIITSPVQMVNISVTCENDKARYIIESDTDFCEISSDKINSVLTAGRYSFIVSDGNFSQEFSEIISTLDNNEPIVILCCPGKNIDEAFYKVCYDNEAILILKTGEKQEVITNNYLSVLTIENKPADIQMQGRRIRLN